MWTAYTSRSTRFPAALTSNRYQLSEVFLQTLVSSSSYVYHLDPHTFRDPEAFQPERWLEDPTTDQRQMERNFIPFSRGSRSCTGMHLAYAELHLIAAHLFRRFELANMGTSAADMEWDDHVTIRMKGHLKVSVKQSTD